MVDTFLESKKKQLSREDKSSIGSWDKKIASLCNKINKKKNYYTTSSCAGRIVLLKYSDKKIEDAFLFRTHEKTSFNEIKKALEKISKEYDGIVEFQQSCCILHVACLTLKDSQKLLTFAKESGWQRSGIIGGRRNMVELHSTESMCFPIMNNGKLLVCDDFLKLAIEIANSKLERTWEKIKRLEKLI
jgi:tRNA wybutosine-synthesizing protein 3